MKSRSKTLLVKGFISSSLLLSMSGVLAHNLNFSHLHESVPLSLASSIILGILLVATGLFILPRMEGRHIRTLATTTLLAGVIAVGVGGKLISEISAAPLECVIDNNLVPSQECGFVNNGSNVDVVNNGSAAIQITFTDNGDHNVGSNRSNKNLDIVKLVKGPVKRSVVVLTGNCDTSSNSFVVEAGDSCSFNHQSLHIGR